MQSLNPQSCALTQCTRGAKPCFGCRQSERIWQLYLYCCIQDIFNTFILCWGKCETHFISHDRIERKASAASGQRWSVHWAHWYTLNFNFKSLADWPKMSPPFLSLPPSTFWSAPAQDSLNKNLKVLHVFVKAIRAATRVFVSAVWIRVAHLSDRTSLFQTDHSVWNRFNPQAEPLSQWTHLVHSGSSKPHRSPSLFRLSLILFVSGDLKCFAIPLYFFYHPFTCDLMRIKNK